MKVLPTLHIRSGQVVASGGQESPAEEPQALLEALLGLGTCHFAFVDVDAAKGRGQNRELIARLVRRCRQECPRCFLQVGGGIRSSEQAQFFLDLGVNRIVLGTVVHSLPVVAEQLLARHQDRLSVAIDARNGVVQTTGWGKPTDHRALDVALTARQLGFKRIHFTDIPEEDWPEPDFTTLQELINGTRMPIFMGGTLRKMEHLLIASEFPGLQGIWLDAHRLLAAPDLLQVHARPRV